MKDLNLGNPTSKFAELQIQDQRYNGRNNRIDRTYEGVFF
jgi:hypothetical protein